MDLGRVFVAVIGQQIDLAEPLRTAVARTQVEPLSVVDELCRLSFPARAHLTPSVEPNVIRRNTRDTESTASPNRQFDRERHPFIREIPRTVTIGREEITARLLRVETEWSWSAGL